MLSPARPFPATVLLAGVFAAAAAAQPPIPAAPPTGTAARIQRKTYDFKEAGKEMEYALYVPAGYDKAKKWPLLVALHGLYSNPQQIIRYPGLTDLAEKHGYIVAAPMGYNSHGWYGAKPLVKGKEDDPKNLSSLSEGDVISVTRIVRKDYNVDPDRVYLMGHSMGGGGVLHLALKYPAAWTALAPIAPAIARPATDVAAFKHLPVILVQGDADRLVPVAGSRKWADQMKALKMDYEYIEVPGGDHVTVGFTQLPKIFAFFEAHKKAPKMTGP